MRFDVNVSISDDPNKLGLRTETKNINSFRAVEKAVEYEIKRQTELLIRGEKVIQETRGWDDANQKTFSQRSKEDAHDYRYFPDPDIPPVEIDESYIEEVKKNMPTLPSVYRQLYSELKLDTATAETLLIDPRAGRFLKDIRENSNDEAARRVALWVVNVASISDDLQDDAPWPVSWQNAVKLSNLVAENKLSSSAAKEVWLEMFNSNTDPEEIAEKNNLLQVSDSAEIEKIVAGVLAENSKAAEDVKNGEMKAIGFLVGQVMKASQGKANPGIAQQLIKKQLGL
jgi:aspartyl-tRNA(Asn)/glutamyl-tRNA(Gln) amidotransferase subunit B